MLSKFRAWIPVAILIAISALVCLLNYSPGTFLSGWDTLHPEFNFGLAFERTIFGSFRIEQGLGAVAGHSHMADLPRIILLYISHFVLPLSFLRYLYIFLCAIFGTVGMYFFLQKHLVKNQTASFLGALFYLLNVGTVQTFNVPFEMFTTAFATLPFLFYYGSSYLLDAHKRTRNLILFGIVTILNSPSAYAATLWYVFLGCFIVYFLSLAIVDKQKDKHYFKHFAILLSVFIGLNLYWLIPNLYFIANHGAEIAKANINRLFSDQAFLKNKEFGNLSDLLLLKSFYFDWNIYGGNGHFTDLLAPWISHFKDIKVLIVGYIFGFGYILGAIYSFKVLGKKSIPLFLTMAASLFFLVNDNFPVAPIYNFFQNHVPFFKEALRFPDDKILNVYVFLIAIFFAFSCLFILEKLERFGKKSHYKLIFTSLISILVIFYSLPAFTGNFINSYMRINLPSSYFQMFDYLKTKPQTARVANLPINSPWGWAYYNFGGGLSSYQGAGFLYFGIKQSLLDRDFDRWSPYNESYYREMSYAIYSQDSNLLANVFKKYNIGFVFIDRNVLDTQNPKDLFFDESKRLIEKTGLVRQTKTFENIELFTLKTSKDAVSYINTSVNVNPKTLSTYEDFAYSSFGNYITGDNLPLSNAYFPFRDLIDNQSKLHKDIVSIDSSKISLIPSQKVNNLSMQTLTKNISLIPSDLIVKKSANSLEADIYPNTPVFDQTPSSVPIKSKITTNSKSIAISLNQNEFFPIASLPENTPVAIGKISLKNDSNTLSVFDISTLNKVNNPLASLNPYFSSCAGSTPVTGINKNEIHVTSKGKVCLLIPNNFLSSLSNGKSLLIKPSFTLSENAKVSTCLVDLNTLNCIRYGDTQSGKSFAFNYVLSPSQISKTAIEIFIDANPNPDIFTIKNLTFSYSTSISDIIYSKAQIESLFASQNVSFNKIFLSKNIIYDPGFDIANIKNLKNDCSIASESKKEILEENGQKIIKYTSNYGSFCDHFSYPNLPQNQGYLVNVYSKNLEGLPLSICISNDQTGRCDIYSDLSSFKKMDKDTFLLPPMGDSIGYNVNFENIGIRGSRAKNLIYKIEFIPIPYQFLLNLNTKTATVNQFDGKVEKVNKVSPLFYLVKTNGQPTVLNLNLSYEKGFRAYNLDCSSGLGCVFKALLAPLFQREIDNHVLVNNWSNGWVLNPNQSQVAIIFVPQYFEYIGFLLILFIFSCLTLHHKTK